MPKKGSAPVTVIVQKQQQPNQNNQKKKKKKKKQNNGIQSIVVRAPAAQGNVTKAKPARQTMGPRGSYCVKHSELIGTLIGSEDFTTTSYPINPGLSALFPWLSSIATNYESYRFKHLSLRYAAATGSQQAGTVYLGCEFDSHDAPPTDEGQLASYQDTVTTIPWRNVSYRCDAQNLNKRKTYLVRNGIPAGDIDLYDTGFFIVGTTDNTATPKLGKLWVDYEVELMTPQTSNPGVGNSLSALFTGTDKAVALPTQNGNAPLTAFTVANTLVFTAFNPYEAVFAVNIGGTGLTDLGNMGGTATSVAKAILTNTAGTISVGQYTVSFKRGDTLILNMSSWTSVTGYFCRFGQYNVANG